MGDAVNLDIGKIISNISEYIKYGINNNSQSCCSQSAGSMEDMISFFIYNTVSIFLLLISIIFIVSMIKSYFPPEKVGRFFKNKYSQGIVGNIIGALLGTVTPFCSCSAVTIFIGFVESGVPLGATFSFLVSAPMVNEVAFSLLLALFGIKVASVYVAAGLIIAILVGLIVGKLNPKKYIEGYVFERISSDIQTEKPSFKDRIKESFDNVGFILRKVWIYLIVGMIIGSYIHGRFPENLLLQYTTKTNPVGVIIATLIGIPIYSNAAGVIPIVKELTRLGVPFGTGLAFMMSVTALSLPELIMLRNIMKPKMLAIFIGIVGIAIMFVGYMFNIIL